MTHRVGAGKLPAALKPLVPDRLAQQMGKD
jgi:hypothetical protein